jgi:hypothetical protein
VGISIGLDIMVRNTNKPYRVYDMHVLDMNMKFMDKFDNELDAYRYIEKVATKMNKDISDFAIKVR